MELWKNYEVLIILNDEYNDDDLKNWSITSAKKLKRYNAHNISVVSRGRHRFPYDIEQNRKGSYIQMNFNCMTKYADAFTASIKESPPVIRCMTFRTLDPNKRRKGGEIDDPLKLKE